MLYIHQLLALFQSAVCRKVKSQFWVTHKPISGYSFQRIIYYFLKCKRNKKETELKLVLATQRSCPKLYVVSAVVTGAN